MRVIVTDPVQRTSDVVTRVQPVPAGSRHRLEELLPAVMSISSEVTVNGVSSGLATATPQVVNLFEPIGFGTAS